MRSPLWETAPGALVALLNARTPLNKADAYTLTLADGQTFRWSGSDAELQVGPQLFVLGPGLHRSRVRFVVGVADSELDLKLTDNLGTTINGTPLLAFIRARGLFGARLQVDRVFWGVADVGPVGSLLWFVGHCADAQVDRAGASLKFKSDLALLDQVQVPREVYQPGCLNTLYDAACGKSRPAFTVTGSATGATDARRITFSHALGQAAGYFDMGALTMTSGPNAGVARTVKLHTSGQLTVLQPWPFAIAAGQTFTVSAGCDKTLSTCEAKFSNRLRFRGQPFIPIAETVT